MMANWLFASHHSRVAFSIFPRGWPLREIVNAIFYIMRSGCACRLLLADLPPWGTVYRWFATWRDACVFEKIIPASGTSPPNRQSAEPLNFTAS
jgi:transposase